MLFRHAQRVFETTDLRFMQKYPPVDGGTSYRIQCVLRIEGTVIQPILWFGTEEDRDQVYDQLTALKAADEEASRRSIHAQD